MRRGSLLAGLGLLVAGCVSIPDTYAPPIQRQPMTGTDLGKLGHFVAMSHPDAPKYFVGDIGEALENGAWRWTGQKPTLQFVLTTVRDLRFMMDFSIAEATFAETGPVTISFYVNGRLLDRVRYDSPGEKRFEKPVDPSWLRLGADNIVTAELDRVWVSPEDQVKLGIILNRAGFVE